MKNNYAFTLIELLGIIALIAVVGLIVTPFAIDVIDNLSENNRQNKVKTYVQEIYKAYTLTITENEYYKFDSLEKGGITENNVINFTNEWLTKNVDVLGINCNGLSEYSKVYFDMYQEVITIEECTVDDEYKYGFINESVIKK